MMKKKRRRDPELARIDREAEEFERRLHEVIEELTADQPDDSGGWPPDLEPGRPTYEEKTTMKNAMKPKTKTITKTKKAKLAGVISPPPFNPLYNAVGKYFRYFDDDTRKVEKVYLQCIDPLWAPDTCVVFWDDDDGFYLMNPKDVQEAIETYGVSEVPRPAPPEVPAMYGLGSE